jgi:[ribosomal protein S18]-alanine N-acetyltransferase
VTDSDEVALREMRWWDIEPVLALERELFPEDAWSPGMFWSELAHARGPRATRRYMVAEAPDRRIVGYAGLAAAGGLGDVQTIAAARDQWGTGLGSRLLTDLLQAATAFECDEVLLEVRVDNARAQKLYERFGFEPIGFRRGYYQPGNVDALVMRYRAAQEQRGQQGQQSRQGRQGRTERQTEKPNPNPHSNPQEQEAAPRQGTENHG